MALRCDKWIELITGLWMGDELRYMYWETVAWESKNQCQTYWPKTQSLTMIEDTHREKEEELSVCERDIS